MKILKFKRAWSNKPEEIHKRAYNRINAKYLTGLNVQEYVAEKHKADQIYNKNSKRISNLYGWK